MNVRYDWPVVGQSQVVSFLQKSIAANRLAHAYLFTGPRLVGKTRVAKCFANSLICDKYSLALARVENEIVLPCGECLRCREWQKGIYPDAYWLEREQKKDSDKLADTISVGQVRNLIEKISKRSFGEAYKIIIVPNAEALGVEASNSLLKTLEEPGDKTMIILIAPHKDSVLSTVYSRCQEIRFFPVKSEEIYKNLLTAGVQRGLAAELSKVVNGRPTLAEKFAANIDEYNFYKERLNEAAALLDADARTRLKMTAEMAERFGTNKDEWKTMVDGLACMARDALMLKIDNEAGVVNGFAVNVARSLANKFSAVELAQIVARIVGLEGLLNTNVNLKMSLESILIKI